MNANFIRYATGTVFAIQLSKAQVRALTRAPEEVTCKICKRTEIYNNMKEGVY